MAAIYCDSRGENLVHASAQGLVTQSIVVLPIGVAFTLILERFLRSFLDGSQSVLYKVPGDLFSLEAFLLHFKNISQEVICFYPILVLRYCAPVSSLDRLKTDEVGQTRIGVQDIEPVCVPALVGGFQGEREVVSAESPAELKAGTTDDAGVILVWVWLDIKHAAKKIEMGENA